MERSILRLSILALACSAASSVLRAQDCNQNGIPDSTDIRNGTSLD
ncbi:MAG: hypothetical protein ACUVYA_04400 [Planctomycetota bacterium]